MFTPASEAGAVARLRDASRNGTFLELRGTLRLNEGDEVIVKCIKVDREERPDVDAVYMRATQALTGQGGWPMTVFATPDGMRGVRDLDDLLDWEARRPLQQWWQALAPLVNDLDRRPAWVEGGATPVVEAGSPTAPR